MRQVPEVLLPQALLPGAIPQSLPHQPLPVAMRQPQPAAQPLLLLRPAPIAHGVGREAGLEANSYPPTPSPCGSLRVPAGPCGSLQTLTSAGAEMREMQEICSDSILEPHNHAWLFATTRARMTCLCPYPCAPAHLCPIAVIGVGTAAVADTRC